MKSEIELFCNDTNEAKELIEALEKDFKVNHIFSGCSKPVLMIDGMTYSGKGNIISQFNLKI